MELQTRVDAAGLAAAMEGILGLVSEIKVAAIVQDLPATAAEASRVRTDLAKAATKTGEEVNVLRDSVSEGLAELEDHYYKSMCAVPVVESG